MPLLPSVQSAIHQAKVDGVREMLEDGRYSRRSLAQLAAGIGESESATADLIANEVPEAERIIGRRSGTVYFGL